MYHSENGKGNFGKNFFASFFVKESVGQHDLLPVLVVGRGVEGLLLYGKGVLVLVLATLTIVKHSCKIFST